jgi:hypothetical protein
MREEGGKGEDEEVKSEGVGESERRQPLTKPCEARRSFAKTNTPLTH